LRFVFLLASLGLSPFAFCLRGAEVARVGDTVITTDTVRQTVARNGYNIFEEASARQGLDDAIQFELLAAEAKKLGLDQDPTLARQVKELLVQRLLAQKVDGPLATVRFSDDELLAYYQSHTNDFRKPAIARGHVLTILIAEGKSAEAETKAKQALEEWKTLTPSLSHRMGEGVRRTGEGGASATPESIVKKYSDDPAERINGGQSNFFVDGQPSRRYPPEVEAAMLALKLRGEVTGLIRTPKALYIVGLIERRDAQLTPFDQTKAEVHKRLVRERRQQLLAEYCESLKKDFPVTVNAQALKDAVQPSKPGGGPPSVPGMP